MAAQCPKKKLDNQFPGINDFVIAFAILRQPHLLQWDYNEYNHINNIVITDDERETLSNAIKKSDRFAQRLFERYPVICFSKRIMQGLSFEKQYRQFSKICTMWCRVSLEMIIVSEDLTFFQRIFLFRKYHLLILYRLCSLAILV